MNRNGLSRRVFLRTAALVAGSAGLSSLVRTIALSQSGRPKSPTDESIITERLQKGADKQLCRLPIGELIALMGRNFLNSPYRANTLEEPGEEHLVVNVQEFDCMTFIENCMALARTLKERGTGPAQFRASLTLIRYRRGVIDGYPSRLHYFTDWVLDNEEKGILTDVTRQLGGVPDSRTLDFMSKHRESYAQMAREEVLGAIVTAEKRLSRRTRYYIPKNHVHTQLSNIRTGDIIGITTSIPGLDCSHTGIAVEEKDTIRLLHASLPGGRVQFSERSLVDYLRGHSTQTGIIVARPNEAGSSAR